MQDVVSRIEANSSNKLRLGSTPMVGTKGDSQGLILREDYSTNHKERRIDSIINQRGEIQCMAGLGLTIRWV